MTPPCPWCGEPYEEFIPHASFAGESFADGDVPLPENACESGLGFWVHGGETA